MSQGDSFGPAGRDAEQGQLGTDQIRYLAEQGKKREQVEVGDRRIPDQI